MNPLALTELHASLGDAALDSMTFLNEISLRFPDAISFAAGRPTEQRLDLASVHRALDVFADHLASERGLGPAAVRRTMLQYGRTKGVIHEVLAHYLAVDEGIEVSPEAVVVTVGAQEAMLLVLRALRRDSRDVVLAVDPTYVGLTGAAAVLDMPVVPIPGGVRGIDPERLVATVRALRDEGRRPRALYLVPDFSNPAGVRLDLAGRRELLSLAEEHELLLLEDNPYGLFTDGTPRLPTLKALDTRHRVVHIGSFAKMGAPGARVGFVVADQPVDDGTLLADQLSRLKSMVTVNTAPIAQAVVAGRLLEHGCSMAAANEVEIALYRERRERMLAGLTERFGSGPDAALRWNVPSGGFFVVLDVGFEADDACLERSASRHGVLWTPMRYFSADPAVRRRIRFSASQVDPPAVDEGLRRFAGLMEEEAC